MIGNDIVDLQLAKTQSNWQRPKFIEKIFSKNEQDFIRQSPNPELEVWKLWSRKEAAYKIYNRETGIRGFFPWKLECSTVEFCDGKFVGTVSIDGKIYFTETLVNDDFVYTIAADSIELFGNIISVNKDQKIIKIRGLPYLETGRQAVSITNHGRFEQKITLQI